MKNQVNLAELLKHTMVMGGSKDVRLNARAISRAYGVTLSSARESLAVLVSRGVLLEREAGEFIPKEISARDFQDLMAVRYLLQGTALRSSVDQGGKDWEIDIESAYNAIDAFDAGSADQAEFFFLYKRFHLSIISACNVWRLIHFVDMTLDQCALYFRHATSTDDEEREIRKPLHYWRDLEGHRRILIAVLNRDAEAASEQLSIHLLARNELPPGVSPEMN